VFESQLLESFSKNMLPLLSERNYVIETQTKNCTHSHMIHATQLVCSFICNKHLVCRSGKGACTAKMCIFAQL